MGTSARILAYLLRRRYYVRDTGLGQHIVLATLRTAEAQTVHSGVAVYLLRDSQGA